jgi:hypothetical protein
VSPGQHAAAAANGEGDGINTLKIYPALNRALQTHKLWKGEMQHQQPMVRVKVQPISRTENM